MPHITLRYERAKLYGEVLAIRLVESMSRTEREPTEKERQDIKKYGQAYLPNRYSYEPMGMLKLGIIGNYHSDFQKTVADGKRQCVGQRLNEFVVKLEAEAVRRKRHEEHLGWHLQNHRRD